MMAMLILLLLAFFAALVLTGQLRRYAITSHLIDIPNARSSHTLPTPRGGGLAIVGVFLACVPLFFWFDVFTISEMWAFLGAGTLVAVVGFFDDRRHLPASLRLVVHFCAAIWVLSCLGGMPALPFFGGVLKPGPATFLGVFYLVWLLNLYNFMDGIDGLASLEAISVCAGGALLLGHNGHYGPLLVLAMAVAGFLYWNFPPAKIFMGDGGSGFLGIVLGIFSLQAAWLSPQLFWSWLILLGVFIVDATWTLLRRLSQREKAYQAHRSHAYQQAARRYGSHKTVSLAVVAINVAWLLPIALWVGSGGLPGVLGLGLAYCPLLMLALIFKAGYKEVVG
ncbi:MAG: glycosyltransferase family 4 protein [Methylovulum sp.]|nr:glycosyltransferase family 4 protein [Methylovulum sp.]